MGRKLIVVRHGERMDFTFGDEWVEKCFDSNGKYTKGHRNMPDALPTRNAEDFLDDTPLTEFGHLQGNVVGKGLKELNLLKLGFQIYVSPALRSVQTASAIAAGMGIPNYELKVEPCLFEWSGYCSEEIPPWMTPQELTENGGFSIDKSYEPFLNYSGIKPNEGWDEYDLRSQKLVKHLLAKCDNDLILVAHGGTLEPTTRHLTGRNWYLGEGRVPYCGIGIVEQQNIHTDTWSFISPEHLSHSHSPVRLRKSSTLACPVFQFVVNNKI